MNWGGRIWYKVTINRMDAGDVTCTHKPFLVKAGGEDGSELIYCTLTCFRFVRAVVGH